MEQEEPSSLQASFHRGRQETDPVIMTFAEIFQLITSDRYRESTEKFRYYDGNGQKRQAKVYKDHAEFITPSVICQGGRSLQHVRSYTGIGMGDIDGLEAGVPEQLMTLLCRDPHVLLAHITYSGHGVRIFYLTDITDMKFHPYVYRQGKAYYEQLLHHPFDEHCKNVTRTSNLCHDPNAYYNPSAVPMHIEVSQTDSGKAGKKPENTYHTTAEKASDTVRNLLQMAGKSYTEGNYNDYASSALYLMNNYGVPQEDALSWALREFPDYERPALESIVRSVYLRTGEHGVKQLPKVKAGRFDYASIDDLEAYIPTQASIRNNTILGRREICWADRKGHFRDMTDNDENTLWLRARKSGLNSSQNTFLSILRSEFITDYNPLTSYLESCPPWDGTTDYIGLVASTVHTTNDTEFRIAFRKWIVGIIASVYEEDAVNQTILTFVGEQGIYKTTFFKKLLPPVLKRYFYTKINGGTLTKDDRLTLAEMLVICFEEIDNMRLPEVNQLKAIITMENTNERAPYMRNKDFRPHIASFCATGNNYHFLSDDTGSRRWRVFRVTGIDNPYKNPIFHEGLYSQALSLYREGFCYWYTNEENLRINLQNREFEEPNIEEELICSRFRPPVLGEAGKYISTAEIMECIGSMIKYPLSKNRVLRAMETLAFPRTRVHNGRGFRVVQLTPEEIAGRRDVTCISQTPENKPLPFGD